MRRALKIAAIVLAALGVVVIAGALAADRLAERKRMRVVEISVVPVPYASDEAALRRGKYLYESRGCMECHGADGAGRDVIKDEGGMYIKSPNISPGPGGAVAGYAEADWVRTIRHGVSPRKHPLILMPSKDYAAFTDADLAALVAYVRRLPPVQGSGSVIRFPLVVNALYALGVVKDDAEEIDHRRAPSKPVLEAVSVEHGAYIANMCIGCHGAGLSGGKIPGAPPDWPAAANLTPGSGSAMPIYADAEKFSSMMRNGKRPDGTAVSAVMPFASLRNMNDTDLGALYVYLKSLPARPAGGH